MRGLLVASLIVFGIVGCGGGDDGGVVEAGEGGAVAPTTPDGSAGTDASTGTTPAPGAPGMGVPTLEGRVVEVDPALVPTGPVAIESARAAAEGVELGFYLGVVDCYGLSGVEVVETVEAVTVEVVGGTVPGDRACIAIAEQVRTTVALAEPLGDRAVIDASTGTEVAITR